MSSTDPPPSAVAEPHPSKPKTKRELFQAERLDLWANFVGTFDPLRTRWFEAWSATADAMNAGDTAATVAALRTVAGVFAGLHAATERWASEAKSLRRRWPGAGYGLAPNQEEVATWMSHRVTCWAEWVDRNGGLVALADKVRAKLSALVGEQRELNCVGGLLSFLAHGGTVDAAVASLSEAGLWPGLPSALAVSVVWPPDGTAWPYPVAETPSRLWVDFIDITLSTNQSRYVVDALWEELFSEPEPEPVVEEPDEPETTDATQEPPPPSGALAPRCDGRLLCSPDFGVIHRGAETFTLSPTQREVIRHMVEAWEARPRAFTQRELLEACGSTANYLSDVFKRCGAWGALIVCTAGRKGVYELRFT